MKGRLRAATVGHRAAVVLGSEEFTEAADVTSLQHQNHVTQKVHARDPALLVVLNRGTMKDDPSVDLFFVFFQS